MKESSRQALAHLLRQDDSLQCHEHLLADHLRDVSNLSAEFAQDIDPNSSSWARMAGLWHDLGKYSDAFQDMIRKANGFEAHLDNRDRQQIMASVCKLTRRFVNISVEHELSRLG